jgi:polar amino acid transport system permease protein
MRGTAREPAGGQDFPWWLVAAVAIAVIAAIVIATNDVYSQVLSIVARGVWITILVTIAAFAMASALGLAIALMALSRSRWLSQAARFYVEIIRGVPILVLLFWIAFAGVPDCCRNCRCETFPFWRAQSSR